MANTMTAATIVVRGPAQNLAREKVPAVVMVAASRAARPSSHGTNEQVIGLLSQVSGLTSRD
jgi:hypothetical protein